MYQISNFKNQIKSKLISIFAYSMKSQNLSIKSQHIKACPPFPCWPSALITLLGLGRNIRWPGGIIHIHMRPKLTKVLAGALCRQMRHYIFINSSNGSKHCSRQAGRLVCTELRGKSEKLGADATVYGRRWPRQLHFRLCRWRQGAAQIAALTTPLGLLLLTGYQK